MTARRGTICLFLFLAATLVAGCSSEPKKYKVTGTVKYKGQPIPNGTITFMPEAESGPSMGGAPIKDGQFEIPAQAGLNAGKYKVSISYPDPKGAPPEPKEDEAPGESRLVKELLPEKYNGATELRAEVKPEGPNEFTFDLK